VHVNPGGRQVVAQQQEDVSGTPDELTGVPHSHPLASACPSGRMLVASVASALTV
jgi:hypothetical protein